MSARPPKATGASSNDTLNIDGIAADRLAALVTRLRRTTAASRRQAAQQAQTREFLAAGLRVIEREFALGANLSRDGDQTAAPFFAWLSRAKVAAEVDVTRLPDGGKFELNGDDGATKIAALEARLRGLWEPHRDYIADLLTVALALEHWSAPAYMDADRVESLISGSSLTQAAHDIAFWDLEQILIRHVASFRLQLMATALADRDPELRESLLSTYKVVDGQWGDVYARVLSLRGLQLRSDFSLEMFTNSLTAIAEGLALRLMVEPEKASILNRESRTSLLGTLALILVAACTVSDTEDDRSLAQYLEDTI